MQPRLVHLRRGSILLFAAGLSLASAACSEDQPVLDGTWSGFVTWTSGAVSSADESRVTFELTPGAQPFNTFVELSGTADNLDRPVGPFELSFDNKETADGFLYEALDDNVEGITFIHSIFESGTVSGGLTARYPLTAPLTSLGVASGEFEVTAE